MKEGVIMIRKMMVALGQEAYEQVALDYACQLSAALKARLICTLFAEVPKTEDDEEQPQQIFAPVPVMNAARAACAKYQVEPDIRVVSGRSPQNVCERARTVDMLLLGIPESIKTDGLKLVYDRLDSILLRIMKPTIVVHENAEAVKKILVVHDGHPRSDRVLEVASEIGERIQAPLVCLALGNVDSLVGETSQRMEEYLDFYPFPMEFETQIGTSVAGIIETAPEYDCDLIAIPASKHGRLYEIIFNSITESVVKLAEHAVLVVR
jgi:nucleotide-binding universal stress UspA family protein